METVAAPFALPRPLRQEASPSVNSTTGMSPLLHRQRDSSGFSSNLSLQCNPYRHRSARSASERRMCASVTPNFTENVATSTFTEHSPAQFGNLQDVVIVGGGIAGLATALALHRLGIKPLVLEQAEKLRTEGTTIVLWSNAWNALEILGATQTLRKQFERLTGVEFLREDGTSLLELEFSAVSRDVEVRGVDRKTLLDVLQEPLPNNTILYNSRVIGFRNLHAGFTEVQCENGQIIKTKVLIGCDGAGSAVAKWMEMKPPRYAGYTATRGLSIFPDGHDLKYKLHQILGQGVRAGIVPIDANKVYWFVVFESSAKKVKDVECIRKEAIDCTKGWPSFITEAIKISQPDTLSRRGISDRWMLPFGGPPLYRNVVTLAGDAMHPITPNLGQGGCLALEDAVILARELSKAISSGDSLGNDARQDETRRIKNALQSYTKARWPRVLSLAIRSYLMGVFLQTGNAFFCSIRNRMLPKLLSAESFVGHTFFEF